MALVRVSGYPSNLIKLGGYLYEINYSHESYGIRYYSARLGTKNGHDFSLIINERIILALKPNEMERCFVIGVLRNYASKCGRDDPARILVTAMRKDNSYYDYNSADITGTVSKVNFRKDHMEILVESLRMQGNYDIIPCAAWEPLFDGLEEMVGEPIHVEGFLCERHFQKHLSEGGTEDKCIYEIHINKWEKINDSEKVEENRP